MEILISSENNIMIVEAAKGVMCATSKHGENEHKLVLKKFWSFEAKDLEQGLFSEAWELSVGPKFPEPPCLRSLPYK